MMRTKINYFLIKKLQFLIDLLYIISKKIYNWQATFSCDMLFECQYASSIVLNGMPQKSGPPTLPPPFVPAVLAGEQQQEQKLKRCKVELGAVYDAQPCMKNIEGYPLHCKSKPPASCYGN
jgi:hypothetical protein